MERSTLDLWVGLFVCAGVGALLILAMKVGNMASIGMGSQSYTIYANFDNIGGLKPRAPVKSAGVVVGRVASVGFDNNKFNARVELTIDSRYKFPKDTGASILTSGLLGEQYIGLDAGGDPADLGNGDSLKLTQSAVVLEKLISQFLYSKAAEGDTSPKPAPADPLKAPAPAPAASATAPPPTPAASATATPPAPAASAPDAARK